MIIILLHFKPIHQSHFFNLQERKGCIKIDKHYSNLPFRPGKIQSSTPLSHLFILSEKQYLISFLFAHSQYCLSKKYMCPSIHLDALLAYDI